MSRQRSQATEAELAEALEPVVAEHGRSWIRYDEAEAVHQSKTDAEAILNQPWVGLAVAHMGFTFKKTVVRGAMDILAGKHAKSWNLSAQQQEDLS
jgi:hypothetical protein